MPFLASGGQMTRVWVVGEALIDLIPVDGQARVPLVGGCPANTAKAVSRLGYETSFIGGISGDDYGQAIDAELMRSGVDLSLVHRGDLPTALAIATIGGDGSARYEFELEGTATFSFNQSWLPKSNPDVIHVGSVATLLEPGASELLAWISSKTAPVVFDPNVRPSIQGKKELYRAAVERWIDVSSIVKLSEDDLDWLYGHESIVKTWFEHGVSLVIITRGEKGMSAITSDFTVNVSAAPVEVIDTVGAGDTIGAVIVEGILRYGISGLNGEKLFSVLERAAKAASITCSRAGANPPWRAELDEV